MTGMFRWLNYRVARLFAKPRPTLRHESEGSYPFTPRGNWRWYRDAVAPKIVADYERERGQR